MRTSNVSWLLLVALCSGCLHARPFSVDEHDAVVAISRHFDAVFPQPASDRAVGLLRPRMGIPAILEASSTFSIELLQRGPAAEVSAQLVESHVSDEAAIAGTGCIALSLAEQPTRAVEGNTTLRTFVATAELAPGSYDLVVRRSGGPFERAPRAVFVRAAAGAHDLLVVQLSDLHLGRPGQVALVEERLATTIREVNAMKPDVVIVTGDMAEQGHVRALEDQAHTALRQIEAPLLVIPGNHDYGHWPKIIHAQDPDYGWYNFAHAFHGYRFFRTKVGDWDFVGFDSGPEITSLRIMTRGMSDATVKLLADVAREDAAQGRGTLLFSHALTRSALSTKTSNLGTNKLGSMWWGSKQLEHVLFDAAKNGERILHLGGHTHWSDVFLVRRDTNQLERLPFGQLTTPLHLDAPALIVNAPSTTRITFESIQHGKDYGFVTLRLLPTESVVQFYLYDASGRRVIGAN